MEQKYIVIQDDVGVLRPMAFISPLDEAGGYRAGKYSMREGEKMVIVEMKIISDYK